MAAKRPRAGALLSTAEGPRYRGRETAHATVCPGVHEWARAEEGAGPRAVHGHAGAGAGAALRTDLRACRGVHKPDRQLDVATDEAMVKTKRVTPELSRRLGSGGLLVHTGYT